MAVAQYRTAPSGDNMKIVTFQVSRKPTGLFDKFNMGEAFYYIDWSDLSDPTQTLQKQIINNYANYKLQSAACQRGVRPIMYAHNGDNPDYKIGDDITGYIKPFDLSKDDADEACAKYAVVEYGIREVISRDTDALEQRHFNVELHAVVLLNKENEYWGHIYAWVSPTEHNYCFAMGIRSRVDSILLSKVGKTVRNVSGYLLEGVRQFALSKGCHTIIIPSPMPVMKGILTKLGFAHDQEFAQSLSDAIVGISIAPRHSKSNEYYYRTATAEI